MSRTPLDDAHHAFAADAGNETAQLDFYGRLAATELFVMLQEEPQGDQISPEIFDVADARFVLVFDLEERLAQFAGRIVPYVALPGRSIAAMLAGQSIGLALNPDVAPSSTLVAPETVHWLAQTLEAQAQESEARISEIRPPHGLPPHLLTALDTRLAAMTGLARSAYLVGTEYDTGTQGHLLGVIDAAEDAQSAIVRAVQEALSFSGLEAAALDVAFFGAQDMMAAMLARHGLRFDLPQPDAPTSRPIPGSDPDAPPKLR